ncbi:MAG: NADPH-dependent F420 reductase [Candidatus Promineifilaceae bacterium]|nr:NADPH-dependent F420 reductase [Candidatus Promineifilaceae bacterium]
MKIAIIGTGNVGGTLGARWGKAGHTVVYGSRQPEREDVQALVANSGDSAAAAPPVEAVAGAEVVLLAVPWRAAEDAATTVANWQNKILIDATNPIAPGFQLAVGGESSGAEQIAARAHGARVVKAFNTTGWDNMADPDYDGEAATMFICGDDEAAKETVADLAETLGFDVADVGGLAAARWLEPMAMAWISLAMRQGLGRNIAFRLMRR